MEARKHITQIRELQYCVRAPSLTWFAQQKSNVSGLNTLNQIPVESIHEVAVDWTAVFLLFKANAFSPRGELESWSVILKRPETCGVTQFVKLRAFSQIYAAFGYNMKNKRYKRGSKEMERFIHFRLFSSILHLEITYGQREAFIKFNKCNGLKYVAEFLNCY